MADSDTMTKKTRAKKTTAPIDDTPTTTPQTTSLLESFDKVAENLKNSKNEVEQLEKEITETKTSWLKEQKAHEMEISQNRAQTEIERQREQEAFDYDTKLSRKKAQDEFEEKKLSWEKELNSQKDQLATERKELASLRKAVEDFPAEKDKAVKDAVEQAVKALHDQLETDKKLSDQQTKSQTEILNMKIANLEAENSRQVKETENLKKSLEEITRQFREVAVRTIDASRPEVKPSSNQ